jgi:hypothetical protein
MTPDAQASGDALLQDQHDEDEDDEDDEDADIIREAMEYPTVLYRQGNGAG